ncbi:MAG: AgmX/PglI C-terminal domain-containing protein [Bdellovibrionaceae bacterium]|nr:AgmX/PglI C-terminal domain-containing protein [Bdellovibrionales bacterium]MCB9085690.1 AgmX/PglI C-terminal domain-containing protein [Pseudobdellovibrionaceae bacterium]
MTKPLVIENNFGEVVRTIPWDGGVQLSVIRHIESGRIEVTSSPEQFGDEGTDYQFLGPLNSETLKAGDFEFGNGSRVKLAPDIQKLDHNEPEQHESNRVFYWCLSIVFMLQIAFVIGLNFVPEMSPELEEELKEHVLKVVKRAPPPPQTVRIQAGSFDLRRAETKPTKTASTKRSVSRMGALGVLGSLKNSKQRGGLDLGAAQTSAGVGLGGGTQGSGGVQTSLYGKGLVAAPLGEGGNIRGGGGYGTKGKGGGRAGYGKLTMIGSAGNNSIPLGTEAIIDGGLDRDAVARVMEANKGQVLFCYEQGLQSDPGLNGRIALRFSIGSDGLVSQAAVASSTLNSKIVESCVLQRLKTWQFPIPKGGMEVKISYPYMLKRKGHG